MTFRSSCLGAVALVLSGLVLAGCATATPSESAGQDANPEVSGKKRPSSEADLEKRIQTVAHYASGLSYDLNDKPDLALAEMLRAAQADPTYEPVVIEAARRCLRAKQPEKAIGLLTRATALPGASGGLYAWLGLAYAQAEKTDLAIAANRTAIKKAPLSLAAYQNLAQLYLQTSRTNEALKVLNEAAQQTTDDPGFLLDLSDLYLRYGKIQTSQDQAITTRVRDILDRTAALAPSNPIHLLRLADAYFALGDLKKAEPFYRQLVEDHPELSSVRSKLTEIYLRSGQKEKASQQMEALAQSEPTNPQAYVFLGALAADEKKYAEAAEHFDRALKLDPDLEQVYYDLASLKLTLKKPEEALSLMEKARSRFKMSFAMEFYSGLACSELKKYAEALNYLTSAEAIAKATEPSRLNHLFYFQVGSTQERAGHLEEAEKDFRECLKLSPDDPETLNYLGYMWADRGMKLEEARSMIEKAVGQQPDNPAFLDSLAWVLFKQNKPREALTPMLKAIQHTDEADPTLYDHLGDIYSSLQQYDKARDAWNKALKVEPNPEIEQKLHATPSSRHSVP